ncbi:PF08002 domain protein [Leptospira kirschneri str. H2]|uniref:PF08002 domain protein n=1 Tax=Leptospira kirschneri str. H1 TaxID=1049966 RepID=A0A0E2AX10_9LEPT|nr:PF08002 domain protein [Leptospira kirschneri str. H1]EKO63122.1 PF08002 domain protein [Leptospira kirschneri str. H2]
MKTYIALLRGINVSGQKKILMKDLSSIFESLGFMNVKTYIQSGNVLFQDKSKNVKELIALIEKKNQRGFWIRSDSIYQIQRRIKNNHSIQPLF